VKSPLGSLIKPRNASSKPPVPIGNGRAMGRGLSYNLGNGRQDAETYMRQYGMSGTLYGIISLLAEAAATPTWKLYKKQPQDGRVRYTTADKGSDQRVQVVQHAAIQLWNNPNCTNSGFEFREGSQQHQELTGETFWVMDTEAGFPTSIWYVRPDRMDPVPDADGNLTGWIYSGPSGEQVPLKDSEVILEKRPNPLDPYRGAGPVASILPNIQQQRYATEYQRNLFLNGADPGGVITVPGNLTEPQFDELIDRWRESHRGVARAGQVGVLEAGMTWTANAHTNKDLEYGELRLANRDELREAWRIHKTMMGTSDDVNRANAVTAQEVFVAWQVIPRLNRRRDTLNSKLLPLFGRGGTPVEFDFDDPSPANAESAATELLQKTQSAQALVAAGYDPHDVLEVVGLPDMGFAAPAVAAPPPGAFGQDGADPVQNRRREIVNVTPPAQNPPQQPGAQPPPQQLQTVDDQWKDAVAVLVALWLARILPGWRASLLTQIRGYIAAGNPLGFAVLELDADPATALILDHAAAFAGTAARQAAAEAAAQGVTGVTPHPPTRADLEPMARTAAELQAKQLSLTAGREAARIGSAPDADPDEVPRQVGAFLDGLSDAQVTQAASGVLSAAQNTARLATIAAGPRAELRATEMHDGNACDPCEDIDGTVFGMSDDPGAVAAAQAAYPAGGYVLCEGGARCRGTMYADYSAAKGVDDRYGPPVRAGQPNVLRIPLPEWLRPGTPVHAGAVPAKQNGYHPAGAR
jgi:HK97 family phage portal protein